MSRSCVLGSIGHPPYFGPQVPILLIRRRPRLRPWRRRHLNLIHSMPAVRFLRVPAVAAFAAIASCATARANYSLNTVPEEGGIRFARITSSSDQVSGPTVVRTGSNGLTYPAVTWFDVSPDDKSVAFLAKKNRVQNVFVKAADGGVAATQRT